MKKKLFVLSMDAMVREDVEVMLNKPNFRRIMEKRAEVDKVCTVYPASTYPAHTSLMTGCYPKKHGVYANFPVSTWQDGISHWPLYHTSVFCQDIFAVAKAAGLTTASVFWPITGCNPNIDHVINEYFFYYPQQRDQVEETFAQQGADQVALQAVRENMHLFPGPEPGQTTIDGLFDHFIMGCTCSLIRNASPDLLMVHNCLLDTYRHKCGVFGPLIPGVLDQMDLWLGDVIAVMEDAGVYEHTDFVILSDHGQREYTKRVNINALLREGGFLQVAPDGTLYEWQAFGQSNGHSITIYLRDHSNQKLYDRVYTYLKALQETGEYGIEKIFTLPELEAQYGQKGPYSFMLEAAEGYGFSAKFTGDAFGPEKLYCGHGYQPEKGPQPIFMAHGPSFRDGAVVARTNIVDIAPTLAATFGQTLSDADGKVLETLLK